MMMNTARFLFLALILLSTNLLQAEELLMARTQTTFPEAMVKLQMVLKKHDYTLSRVQRVDIGLTEKGYKTDKYRVVFFGKADEVELMTKKYPELIPYLPYKIAIFAEAEETLIVASNPEILFSDATGELKTIIKHWHDDLISIFHDMRQD
jgi:uncharacterized protein (DUF302 family)